MAPPITENPEFEDSDVSDNSDVEQPDVDDRAPKRRRLSESSNDSYVAPRRSLCQRKRNQFLLAMQLSLVNRVDCPLSQNWMLHLGLSLRWPQWRSNGQLLFRRLVFLRSSKGRIVLVEAALVPEKLWHLRFRLCSSGRGIHSGSTLCLHSRSTNNSGPFPPRKI
ncbi:unnamed protein product [Penicillium nalgiovense]|nr:unnamed protein product [Penicillium nalgiovense]